MRSTPQVSHIRAGRELAGSWPGAGRELAGSWPGAGRELAGSWPGAGRELAGSWPGRSIACRAACRLFCLRAGQAGSGHKKTPGDFPRGVVRGQRAGLAVRVSVGLDAKPHVAPWDHDAAVKRCAARGATPSQIRRLGVAVPVAMVNAEQCDALGAS